MASTTLLDRLQDEAKNQPLKASALAIGLFVMVYMWWPILNVSQDAEALSSQSLSIEGEEIQALDAVQSLDQEGKPTSASEQWFDRYQEFKTLGLLEPVAPTIKPLIPSSAIGEQEDVPESEMAKGDLGEKDWQRLVLHSVLIGDNSRYANLNSKIVEVGQVVWINFSHNTLLPVAQPSSDAAWTRMKIVAIRSNEIDLEIGQQVQTLKVKTLDWQ